jgi:hypothetical protein
MKTTRKASSYRAARRNVSFRSKDGVPRAWVGIEAEYQPIAAHGKYYTDSGYHARNRKK